MIVFDIFSEETVSYHIADLGNWQAEKGLAFWKELIYEDTFYKDDTQHSVTLALIKHWVKVSTAYLANGNEIPLPIGHTVDAEASRGHVVAFERRTNSKGKASLWGRIEFIDENAARLAKSANVSIFSPPEYTDGKNVHYYRPILHVALTNYPVVPGLSPFEIAASFAFSQFQKESETMSMKELADKLGVRMEDGDDDEKLATKIMELVAALKKEKEEEKPDENNTEVPEAQPVAASYSKMLGDNRRSQLEGLVGKTITPSCRDQLLKIFTSETALTFALQADPKFIKVFRPEEQEAVFQSVVTALSQNNVLELGHKTGPQQEDLLMSLPLDKNGKEVNLLALDAERRAKEAKE